jgi:hypothetical protein
MGLDKATFGATHLYQS